MASKVFDFSGSTVFTGPANNRGRQMNSEATTQNLGETNNLALVSVLLSAGVLILGPFGSIPGIVLGRRALQEYRKAGVEQGQAMAKAAVCIGWIGLGLFLLACIGSIIWMVIAHREMDQMLLEFEDFDSSKGSKSD